MFRELTKDEVEEFKLWARENYDYKEIKDIWHPVVREECRQMVVELHNGYRKKIFK